MQEVLVVLEFLKSNPGLSVPLIILLLFWPVAKRAGTMADEGLDRAVPHLLSTRAAVFVLLVHLAAVTIAAVICYGFTDVPSAGYLPSRAELFGVNTERFFGYGSSVVYAIMNVVGVLAGNDHGNPLTKLTRDIFGARMALFGLVGAAGVTAYSAFYDPSIVAPVPEFPSLGIALAWWYTTIPLVSIVLTVVGYLFSSLLRFLWNLSGKLT